MVVRYGAFAQSEPTCAKNSIVSTWGFVEYTCGRGLGVKVKGPVTAQEGSERGGILGCSSVRWAVSKGQFTPARAKELVSAAPLAGQALYCKIAPMVQAREAYLFEGLSSDDKALLRRTLDHVLERARQLARRG